MTLRPSSFQFQRPGPSRRRGVTRRLALPLLGAAAMLAAGCQPAEEDDVPAGSSSAAVTQGSPDTFPIPRAGLVMEVSAGKSLSCTLRETERTYTFPAGALDPAVSSTGKTMCFTQARTVHCHVSGTETGFCRDKLNNVTNAVRHPPTVDGDFVQDYVREHPKLRIDVSGHSQGAYDASRVAPLLGKGDQLILLQPASSALSPNDALLDAIDRAARVYVAWSPNDEASLGIRLTSGDVPLIELPRQQVDRMYNAPNARDQFHRWFGIADRRTVNPALDASVLSNPGSPEGPWRFPAWDGTGEEAEAGND